MRKTVSRFRVFKRDGMWCVIRTDVEGPSFGWSYITWEHAMATALHLARQEDQR